MKTAISIPDAVFEEAEWLAKRRGWSRSELYANAVAEYVKGERFLGVRERLDAVYGKNPTDSELDLSMEWFRHRIDAKIDIEQFRPQFNGVRPHPSLGQLTPAKFIQQPTAQKPPFAKSSVDRGMPAGHLPGARPPQ